MADWWRGGPTARSSTQIFQTLRAADRPDRGTPDGPAVSATIVALRGHLVRDAIVLIACGPLAYYAVATLATARFFWRERKKRLGSYTPPVSVLKPVHGVDFASY